MILAESQCLKRLEKAIEPRTVPAGRLIDWLSCTKSSAIPRPASVARFQDPLKLPHASR
ncbi:hypothetical protein [Cereibacter azotoformans]|uniref:hypothetical protein n=1 Tax=Cereibacter azotoformans TaxID=43057 RepID=UPI002DD420C8|nr:hypothetical protein [Cereibacter azotoformans]